MTATLEFTAPPRGLESTEWVLAEVENTDGRLLTLRDADGQRFFVIPGAYMPTYRPTLADDQVEELGLTDADDAAVYAIVNPSNGKPTVNLLAPIVVNTKTGAAAQFLLDGDWPIRQPLDEMV